MIYLHRLIALTLSCLFIIHISASGEQSEVSAGIKKQAKKMIPTVKSVCQFNPEKAPNMVKIPAGDFSMGALSSQIGSEENERPVHRVWINSFEMSRCAVTVEAFKQFVDLTGYITDGERNKDYVSKSEKGCMSWNIKKKQWSFSPEGYWKNPGFEQTEQDPVTCVSWNDAVAYIDWLNKHFNENFRLPTEAEWEYAAKALNTIQAVGDQFNQDTCRYANGADVTTQLESWWQTNMKASECDDGYAYMSPVASLKPNGFGLYDMHGNVWEWVQDCWHENYVEAPQDGSPWLADNDGDCYNRVLRGAAWISRIDSLLSTKRNWYHIDVADYAIGFRLAKGGNVDDQ